MPEEYERFVMLIPTDGGNPFPNTETLKSTGGHDFERGRDSSIFFSFFFDFYTFFYGQNVQKGVFEMKKTLYVVLRDIGLDLGEGYSSSSSDEFVGVVNDFQTARNIIEYFIDQLIGEIDEDRSVCKSCPKNRGCRGCEYYEHGTVQEDDWDDKPGIVVFDFNIDGRESL